MQLLLDSLQTLASNVIYALSMYLLTFINLRHNGNVNLARYCLSFLFTIELLEMSVGQGYHNR